MLLVTWGSSVNASNERMIGKVQDIRVRRNVQSRATEDTLFAQSAWEKSWSRATCICEWYSGVIGHPWPRRNPPSRCSTFPGWRWDGHIRCRSASNSAERHRHTICDTPPDHDRLKMPSPSLCHWALRVHHLLQAPTTIAREEAIRRTDAYSSTT